MDGPPGPPPLPPPPSRGPGPRFWIGLGLGLLALMVLFLAGFFLLVHWAGSYFGKSTDGGPEAFLSAPRFPAPEAPADYDLALETMDGRAYDPAQLRGRTVFLNYWATWCGPCRAEMPSIERLQAKTRDLGVVFLLVSDEERDAISAYARENALSVPVFRATGARPAAYQSDGIPATFILSPDGRIAFRHVGAARWDHDSAIAFLKGLQPAPPP